MVSQVKVTCYINFSFFMVISFQLSVTERLTLDDDIIETAAMDLDLRPTQILCLV